MRKLYEQGGGSGVGISLAGPQPSCCRVPTRSVRLYLQSTHLRTQKFDDDILQCSGVMADTWLQPCGVG